MPSRPSRAAALLLAVRGGAVTKPLGRAVLAIAALLTARPGAAHETLHEIARGKAIAVKVSFADGEALAYRAFEVYSPADPRIPHQNGRTDRGGWLAFVPDAPGAWRVRVVDDAGHGLDLTVDATGTAPTASAEPSSAAFVFRPLLGALVVAAAFAALFFTYRRKGSSS